MLEDYHRFLRGFLQRDASMRALWSDRPNCSHNVFQKVERIKRFSETHTVTPPLVAGRLMVNCLLNVCTCALALLLKLLVVLIPATPPPNTSAAIGNRLRIPGPSPDLSAHRLGGQTCNNERATSICPILSIIFSSLLFSLR